MFVNAITYNRRSRNIFHISGALFTLKIQYKYAQTQCEEGARDVNKMWVTVVIKIIFLKCHVNIGLNVSLTGEIFELNSRDKYLVHLKYFSQKNC